MPPKKRKPAKDLYAERQERLREVRRERLRLLLKDYATLTEFADVVDESLSYISRLVQDKAEGRRSLGEGKARKFEEKLGLARGWFDYDEDAPTSREQPAADTQQGWPFKFPAAIWQRLPAPLKRKAEDQLLTFIQGLEAQHEREQQQKRTG